MDWNIKKGVYLFLLLVFGLFANVHAILIDNGNGTITDTDTNLMWLQDLNLTDTLGYDDSLYGVNTNGALTWQDALDWASDLDFAGYTDWRLPTADATCSGTETALVYNCNGGELGQLYYDSLGNSAGGLTNPGPFTNFPVNPQFWTSTEFDATRAFDFHFNDGGQHPWNKAGPLSPTNVIAVREIASVSVPAPAPLLLIAGGVVGLVLSRRHAKT